MKALIRDKSKASEIVKEHDEEFDIKSKKLFGKGFEKTLKKKAKTKKASRDFMYEFHHGYDPFHEGPSGRGAPRAHKNENKHRGQRGKRSFSKKGSPSQKLSNDRSKDITIKFAPTKYKHAHKTDKGESNNKTNNSRRKKRATSLRSLKI